MARKARSKDPFEDVAAAIAEGRAVDWDAARAAVGSPSPELQKFELIQGIAQAFRAENEAMAPLPAALAPAPLPAQAPLPQTGNGKPVRGSTGSAKTVSADPKESEERAHTLFTWGPLLALEEIGKGAFANVYRAYDPTLDREVALKLRREDAPQDERTVSKFIDEARKLARIHHPHVLKVHGADIHNGRVGIWTDLVRGRTLSEIVKQDGPFGADEVILCGMDLSCALASLHANNLVHRDIKPSNVMREQGGNLVLMDFGSAGDLNGLSSAPRHTFSGTPVTTAPEVLVDCEAPTAASDIYSLGVLLYWLVSGRYPVEADGLPGLVQMHKRGESRPLLDVRPDVPRAFAQVVERALARDPQQRFASTGDMQHALAGVLAVRPPAKASMRTRLARHRRAVVVGAAAAMVVAAAVGVWHWYFGPVEVDVKLHRVRGSVTEALSSGGRVQGGDQIFLELRGAQKTYAWVVNEDSKGTARFLFPLGSEETPVLGADRVHRLPFQGQIEMNWQIDSEGESETLLVIASRRRLRDLEQRLLDLAQKIAAPHRGIAPDPIPVDPRPKLIAQLTEQLRGERGVWVQPIVLMKDVTP